ncbi:hypothetical protein PV433_25345 [Paenibacillus sp. GYB004]|uniref:hypothetical protein n=1 Tax=Paenibacillus sp. GYB004 TaxID=2994393 RepID=UPI002F968C2C
MFNFSMLAADRAAAGLDQKIRLCSELQISNMELNDELEGKSIADWSGEEVEYGRNQLIANHKKIVLLNGSRPVTDYEYYKKLLAKALLLHVEHVKVTVRGTGDAAVEGARAEGGRSAGLWAEPGEDEIEALRKLATAARVQGIGLVVENDSSSCLSDDRKLTALYNRIKDENTAVIYNPLEFVRVKAHPFFHAFYNSKLKGKIRFLRVNDGLFADGRPVLPGEGNAEVKELASILLKRSYKGYFSFTPYMPDSDPALYRSMLDRFHKMLMEL